MGLGVSGATEGPGGMDDSCTEKGGRRKLEGSLQHRESSLSAPSCVPRVLCVHWECSPYARPQSRTVGTTTELSGTVSTFQEQL